MNIPKESKYYYQAHLGGDSSVPFVTPQKADLQHGVLVHTFRECGASKKKKKKSDFLFSIYVKSVSEFCITWTFKCF